MHVWKPDTHAVSSDGRRERQGVMAVSVASSKSPTMPERICAAVVDAMHASTVALREPLTAGQAVQMARSKAVKAGEGAAIGGLHDPASQPRALHASRASTTSGRERSQMPIDALSSHSEADPHARASA